MAFWKIATLACATYVIVDAKWLQHQKREIPTNICDSVYNNNTNKVQCYCTKDNKNPNTTKHADCYLTHQSVSIDDSSWYAFKTLKTVHEITLTNTRGVPMTYVPTQALKEASSLKRLEIKYATLSTIESFAFANHSSVEEIILSGNQIVVLEIYAFAHHKNLKIIGLDSNGITEINRNVFVDLPELEKIYLTSNQISTIHDRAFVHLTNLRELEIDRNKVFSLNFATFAGLKKLEKLDLSSNSLEVIGDNTFQALESLKSLNLEGNKIQMLDEKAFYGLGNLQYLTLARNKLTKIDNENIFVGLNSLVSLGLRGNQIKELNDTVMVPILNNFYGENSNFDVEDNSFPCDCRLDWFMSLMNKTLNKHLKITIENLKCFPDASLREAWSKSQETEKNAQQVFEDEESQVQGAEYEYYDEPQLNGTLFYLDVRDLLKCNKDLIKPADNESTLPTKESTSFTTSTVVNHGVLDVSIVDTSTTSNEITKSDKNKRENNDMEKQAFTTTRLATVSAKPGENKIYENMASDEAKPDKVKAHRSIQERGSRTEEDYKTSNSNKNLGCAILLVTMVLFYSLFNF